jgi:hypothetical protein
LSPPDINGLPSNPTLVNWALNPYVEANYIFLSDPELINLAKSDNSFIFKDMRVVNIQSLYGAGNDVEMTLTNLCTRVIWIGQRSDVAANNGVDNYTNQAIAPPSTFQSTLTPWFTNGRAIGQNQSQNDILIDGTIILDGAERFNVKPFDFFSLLENYRHQRGLPLPGMYMYSFALDNDKLQPSGHLNGSMFNRTLLRLTLQDPPFIESSSTTNQCVVKSTVFNQRPSLITNVAGFNPEQAVNVITKTPSDVRPYTYGVRVFVESYNFLRITRGIANVVFSS